MSKLDELIKTHCPDGVEYKPLWSLTAWDKKFNGVDKSKQKKVCNYKYYLSADFDKVEDPNGDVLYLSTGINTNKRYTTKDLAGDYLAYGEVVCIPWGGTPNVKYHKGYFVTGDNRIATSLDCSILDNKFLYYYLSQNINLISSFYRGSGIKHPSMKAVLELSIPVPPLEVQGEIVRILDNFTELTAALTAALTARKKQYEYYRNKLLTFDDTVPLVKIGSCCKLVVGGDVPKDRYSKDKTEQFTVPIYSNGYEDKALYGYTDIEKITVDSVTIAGRGVGVGYCALRKAPYYPIIRLICAIPNTQILTANYLKYAVQCIEFKIPTAGIPQLTVPMVKEYKIPLPSLEEQKRIVSILDRFDALCNDISIGLPAEIEARKKQYEYYRYKLLTFKSKNSEVC